MPAETGLLLAQLAELQERLQAVEGQVYRLAQSEGFTTPHGGSHEIGLGDEVRLAILNGGSLLNRQRAVNFGTGLTATEDQPNKRINVVAASGFIGAPFVTIGNDATLTAERALTGTANQITVTDGGANGAVTLSVPSAFLAPGSVRVTTDLTVDDQLIVSGVGPHAIGGATFADRQVTLTGTFAPASGNPEGMRITSTFILPVGSGSYGLVILPTITEAASGVHSDLVGLVVEPLITGGVATVTNVIGIDVRSITAAAGTTNATGLLVAAPTGATNNRAINVTSGDIYKAGSAYNNPHGAFELAYTGRLEAYADRMAEMGLGAYRHWSLADLETYTREHLHFPYFEDDAHIGFFGGGERHLLMTELLAVGVFGLREALSNVVAVLTPDQRARLTERTLTLIGG